MLYYFEQTQGLWNGRNDIFELSTLAARVIVAETSEVFSNTANYPISGVLLRGVAAAMLPILLYGFNGNLKVYFKIKDIIGHISNSYLFKSC